jgi:predicted CXXCH cytochrome family protein
MTNQRSFSDLKWPLIAGVTVFLLTMLVALSLASAASAAHESAPLAQTGSDHPAGVGADECASCHLDITNTWKISPHANAFEDPVFQERLIGVSDKGDCLGCHTTNFQASTGEYTAEGVSCEACHGQMVPNHPPSVIPIKADTEYCGTCHTTTLQEWRLTGHATAGVGCLDCHDPHSQQALFEVKDDMCINCHKEDMEKYLEDTHVQKDIGCVDCHALVIPPDPVPLDGIVPTGHAFTITPATCVACHTDSLHAGFSLPGFEHGASAATGAQPETSEEPQSSDDLLVSTYTQATTGISAEQRIQALEAALASNRLVTIFQGGVVGLVLGGSTAWFISSNLRGQNGTEPKSAKDEEEVEE